MEGKKQSDKGIFWPIVATVVLILGGQILTILVIPGKIDVGALSSFYSTLFTAIAVIIGIIAIVGWGWLKDLKEKSEEFKEVAKIVNFLIKKQRLADWAKEKVDKLGLSTFELKNLDREDKETLKEIKDYVINDLTNCGWLELFLAHQYMTEEKKFEKAESILKFVESRDLLDENSKIHSFLYHFLGQLYWEKYSFRKMDSNRNYFRSKNDTLRSPNKIERKSAIELLNNSHESYEKSIYYIQKRKEQTMEEYDDRSYANNAIVLLELYKFYYLENNIKKSVYYLKKAKQYLDEKIKKKDYNNYYDLARVYFYQDEKSKFLECLECFKEKLDFCESKEKIEIKTKHFEYMKEESDELDGKGFPGKDFDIKDFFKSIE